MPHSAVLEMDQVLCGENLAIGLLLSIPVMDTLSSL